MSTRLVSRLLAVVAAVAPLAACSPTIKQPRLLHPGPAPVQRYTATQFDPYPLPDLGPEIVGGRPPDYLVPVPEVKRANQFREQHPAPSLPVLVPQVPVGAPVITTTPDFPPAGTTIPPVEYRY
jgi:hypothetical protein